MSTTQCCPARILSAKQCRNDARYNADCCCSKSHPQPSQVPATLSGRWRRDAWSGRCERCGAAPRARPLMPRCRHCWLLQTTLRRQSSVQVQKLYTTLRSGTYITLIYTTSSDCSAPQSMSHGTASHLKGRISLQPFFPAGVTMQACGHCTTWQQPSRQMRWRGTASCWWTPLCAWCRRQTSGCGRPRRRQPAA